MLLLNSAADFDISNLNGCCLKGGYVMLQILCSCFACWMKQFVDALSNVLPVLVCVYFYVCNLCVVFMFA